MNASCCPAHTTSGCNKMVTLASSLERFTIQGKGQGRPSSVAKTYGTYSLDGVFSILASPAMTMTIRLVSQLSICREYRRAQAIREDQEYPTYRGGGSGEKEGISTYAHSNVLGRSLFPESNAENRKHKRAGCKHSSKNSISQGTYAGC